MKVKPFYIRITDDMTPQMVQDAFDKCVDAGAIATDCVEQTAKRNYGWHYHGSLFDWKMFGVCEKDGTYLADDESSFSGNPQEITLDQLDKWLGLDADEEWKNGDSAYVEKCTHDEIKFIGLSGNNSVAVCECVTSDRRVILDRFWVSDLLKEKPETSEQKAERERLEAAYDLCTTVYPSFSGFEEFKEATTTANLWLKIVDKTGYRKAK